MENKIKMYKFIIYFGVFSLLSCNSVNGNKATKAPAKVVTPVANKKNPPIVSKETPKENKIAPSSKTQPLQGNVIDHIVKFLYKVIIDITKTKKNIDNENISFNLNLENKDNIVIGIALNKGSKTLDFNYMQPQNANIPLKINLNKNKKFSLVFSTKIFSDILDSSLNNIDKISILKPIVIIMENFLGKPLTYTDTTYMKEWEKLKNNPEIMNQFQYITQLLQMSLIGKSASLLNLLFLKCLMFSFEEKDIEKFVNNPNFFKIDINQMKSENIIMDLADLVVKSPKHMDLLHNLLTLSESIAIELPENDNILKDQIFNLLNNSVHKEEVIPSAKENNTKDISKAENTPKVQNEVIKSNILNRANLGKYIVNFEQTLKRGNNQEINEKFHIFETKKKEFNSKVNLDLLVDFVSDNFKDNAKVKIGKAIINSENINKDLMEKIYKAHSNNVVFCIYGFIVIQSNINLVNGKKGNFIYIMPANNISLYSRSNFEYMNKVELKPIYYNNNKDKEYNFQYDKDKHFDLILGFVDYISLEFLHLFYSIFNQTISNKTEGDFSQIINYVKNNFITSCFLYNNNQVSEDLFNLEYIKNNIADVQNNNPFIKTLIMEQLNQNKTPKYDDDAFSGNENSNSFEEDLDDGFDN